MRGIMEKLNGMIIKLTGGFYYVEAAGQVYACKARGVFRNQGDSPCVGDRVEISVQPDGAGTVDAILPRKNRLVRPAVANLDRLFIVASVCDPSPNMLVIDKMTAAAVSKDIEPVIVVSKTDLENGGNLKEIYDTAGIRTVCFSAEDNSGAGEIKSLLTGCVAAFTGNSGVGKSTLLNSVFPHLALETSHTSQKLGRGRHTTRTVELFPTDGGYVADTPGFSSVDMQRYELIKKEDLPYCFPEFSDYLGECQFTSCAHVKEKGCAIRKALEDGKIHPSRFASYVAMYEEVKDIREWELK